MGICKLFVPHRGKNCYCGFVFWFIAVSVIVHVFPHKRNSECPDQCSCLGSYVDCSQEGFFRIPEDIPAWVVQLDLSSNRLRDNSSVGLSHLHNLTELKLNKNLFQSIPELESLNELRTLNMAHNNIKEIKMLIRDLEELNLNYNQITELRPDSFPNNNSIKILNLVSNKITVIHKGAFDTLNNLIDLKLSKNRIIELPKHLFGSQKYLRTLEINKNQLRKIDGLVFQGLDRLATLRLRHNNISQFSDGAFFGLKSISLLQLDFNSISVIAKAWMYGLGSLVSMTISNNLIIKIEADSWEFSNMLEELDLSHNKLRSIDGRTLEHLSNLTRLKLDTNKISSITEDAFSHTPRLEVLQLSNNEISWTVEDMNGPFSKLHNLQRFNLSSNYISSIISKAFVGLDSLLQLDLNNNNITTLQEHSFDSMKHLQDLKMTSSSLLCDCNLQWLSVWLQKTPQSHAITATCAYPSWIRGKLFLDLRSENFTCNDSPKPVIIEHPKLQLAIKGGIAHLFCRAISTSTVKMTFLWRRNNRNVSKPTIKEYVSATDGYHTEAKSELLLPNVTHSDNGNYQCIVSNNFGTTYSSKARVTIVTLPKFGKIPMNVTVRAGETAKLECSAVGEPIPQIAWQKDGGNDFPAARERRMHVMTLDDAFFIIDAKLSDMGIYSCTAQNSAGIVVSNASLNVLEAPSFVKVMENKEVTIGSSVVISCMMSGSPKPTLRWLKGGAPIIPTERHFFTADDQLLVIVNVVENDAGLYECEITNSLGTRKNSTELRVFQPVNTLVSEDDMLGIIIITIVCCAVITSIIWVAIIYKIRKRKNNALPNIKNNTATILRPIHHDSEVPHLYSDNVSERSSCKDSGTGDSAKRSSIDVVPQEDDAECLSTKFVVEAVGEYCSPIPTEEHSLLPSTSKMYSVLESKPLSSFGQSIQDPNMNHGGYGGQGGGYPGQQQQNFYQGQPGGYQQGPVGGYPGQQGMFQGNPPPAHGPYPPISQSGVAPEIQQWFSTVDKDRSGHISATELKAALVNAQGKNFSDAACQLMIGMFDKDKSGSINVEEFEKLYTYVNQWLSVFKTYDRDQSGHIEESELSQAFTQMGFRFSPEFIQFLVKKSDLQEHKHVSVDQFIVMCVQVQRFTEAFRMRDNQQQGIITIGYEDFLSVALSCSI